MSNMTIENSDQIVNDGWAMPMQTPKEHIAERTLLSRRKTDIRNRMLAFVDPQHADIAMVICSFVAGIVDSYTYNAWNVFAAMQTGNTVFLGLGAANLPRQRPLGWSKSLVSISSFMLGAFITFKLSRMLGETRRLVLFTSFAIQMLCIFIAAILVETKVVSDETPLNKFYPIQLLPVPFLASQFGAQIATSRIFGLGEIPTTVLTSVYCDLMGDEKLLKLKNVKRNRRAGTAIAILTGAIAGGWLTKAAPGKPLALWVAGSIKGLVAVGWLAVKDRPTAPADKMAV